MATEVIREFLVSLGYKQDEASLRKFEDGINKATKSVVALAAAVEGTAILVAAGIARFASNLEALYFAAVRTSSSAAGLKLLDVAAQNLGASAGEAVASVEAFAQKLRENPGNVALLESLVGQLKHAKDGSVDTLQAFEKFARFLKANYGRPDQPQYLAYQYAGLLGLSPDMVTILLKGDLTEALAKFHKEVEAGNWDEAARKAHKFEEQMRVIGAEFDSIKARVGAGIFTALRPELEQLTKWIETHQHEIEDFVTNSLLAIKTAAVEVALVVGGVIKAYEHLLGIANRLGTWAADHAPRKLVDSIGDMINESLHNFGLISEEDYQRGRKYYDQTYGGAANNPGNLEFHGQPGATRSGRFASFANPQQGVTALARQLELYASRGLTTVQDIISRYAPPSDHNDTAAYIANLTKSLGSGPLDLRDPKVLQALMAGIIRQEGHANEVTPEMLQQAAQNATRDFRAGTFADTVFGQWLTGLANGADAGRVGAGEVAANISQKTDIHVYGGGDPATVAGKVSEAQRRVNQDLARNVAGAVQ